jgi:hypothetical protein
MTTTISPVNDESAAKGWFRLSVLCLAATAGDVAITAISRAPRIRNFVTPVGLTGVGIYAFYQASQASRVK